MKANRCGFDDRLESNGVMKAAIMVISGARAAR